MEIKEGALSFEVENSLSSLLEIRKILYKAVSQSSKNC